MKVLSLSDINRVKSFVSLGGAGSIIKFFDKNMSIEDAEYEYKKIFKERHIGKYINSINERLGFTSVIEYK